MAGNLRSISKAALRGLKVLWASPWTLFGVFLGIMALATGGRCQRVDGVLEFYAGGLPWLLGKAPMIGGASAITFGHTVLAVSQHDLDGTRAHERVHVRQYERWGPLFVPVYLFFSLWIAWRGGDAYRDNPFEVEAYAHDARRASHHAAPLCEKMPPADWQEHAEIDSPTAETD